MRKLIIKIFISVAITSLFGCSLASRVINLTTPTLTRPIARQTATPIALPIDPALQATQAGFSLQPTSASDQAGEERTCVSSKPHPALEAGSFEQMPENILNFLNQGATVVELESSLQAQSMAPPSWAVGGADMTGDGWSDVVVGIIDPNSASVVPGGMLLIFNCSEKGYLLAYNQPTQENWGTPQILFLQDLNADGRADLVEAETTCGASTCFQRLQILVWNREVYENRMVGDTGQIPNPEIQLIGPDAQGFYAVQVMAQGAGSVGAGPQRAVAQVWHFQPGDAVWQPGEPIDQPSNFRIHVLYDADKAAKNGDYAQAEALYQRVIDDPGLQEWVEPATERANLEAYARFKLYVLAWLQSQPASFQAQMDRLMQRFPEGTNQHIFVVLAQLFSEHYTANHPAAACAAVRQYIQEHATQVLNMFDYGYGNPAYSAQDICPWE